MIKTKIKEKTGIGMALFAGQQIPKGTIVFFFGCNKTRLISAKEYIQLVKNGDKNAFRTGCRINKDTFVIYKSNEPNPCEYINHSFKPSLLYYYGQCIASRDIEIGDELTLDYSYIVANENFEEFLDYETGITIKGIPDNKYDEITIKQLREFLQQ